MNLLTTVMICSMFHNTATTNAMIELGSGDKPLAVTVVHGSGEPGNTRADFKTVAQASAYAKQQLALGNHVDIGMMQISSGWLEPLSKEGISLDDLLLPCKNVAVGSDLLNQAEAYCATQTNDDEAREQCALSFYETADTKAGQVYAIKILSYAAAHPLSSSAQNTTVNYKAYTNDAEFSLPVPNFSDDA